MAQSVGTCIPFNQMIFEEDILNKNFIEFNQHANYENVIYTDGSKMEQGTAYAFVVYNFGNIIYSKTGLLRKENTVFQAETYAILQAILWTVHNFYTNIYIFSDSQATIKAIKDNFNRNDIIYKINQTVKNSNVLFNLGWIKAHVGYMGNEMADHLAQNAAENWNSNDNIVQIKYPRSYLKKLLKSDVIMAWQDRWNCAHTGRQTFKFFPRVDTDFLINSPIIVYFTTGHGSFPTFLNWIKRKADNICECGNVGSPDHYLFEICSLINRNFSHIKNPNLPIWIKNTINNSYAMKILKEIYNKLNQTYSSVEYVFL